MAIWMKARIPTTYQQHIVKEYSLIKKKKGRDSKAQQSRQKKADKLFDIAHKDADSLLRISK